MKVRSLKPSELRWTCPADIFEFDKSSEITPSKDIVGQDRAVRAVKLGLEISSSGYNMFVTGVSGSGRETTVKRILDQIDTTTDKLTDLCYVYNFDDSTRPRALVFPAGEGKQFKEGIELSVELLQKNIPVVLRSESTAAEKGILIENFSEQKKEQMDKVEKAAIKAGFAVVSIPVGQGQSRPDVLPVIDGKPYTYEELQKLAAEEKITREKLKEYRNLHGELFKLLTTAIKHTQSIEIKAQVEIERLYRRILKPTVTGILDRLSGLGNKESAEYVKRIEETILTNIDVFSANSEEADPYIIFEVNLIVDNSTRKKRPVVVEQFPDVVRLFGNIDRIVIDNKPYSDHTMIRAGSFLRANGGYLIINAMDVVRQPELWQNLIQTVRNRTVITRPNEMTRAFMPIELQPEPIDVDVKVILIGPGWLYSTLASHDPDFGYLFRIRADFDDRMDLNPENIQDFAGVIAYICQSESVLPLSRDAMASIAEQAVWLTGRNDKISLKFNMVADYVRQASYWAGQDSRDTVTADDVDRAIREKHYRLSLGEDYATNRILENQVMVDTDGFAVGQLNGLAVYSGVDHSFGLPSRITATVSPGVEGIVNVERESELSGRIHTKGVYVITGFFREHFALDYPLSLSAGIVFEQSYGGVDGDSASSTELYALLSALSGVPLRQDIAVTGSVNQHGRIQPIGGVNYKIEGHFRVCKERGLTGTQGVMIPDSNVVHLQLHRDVIEAVEKKQFHIYPISTIEEGISLLAGIEAGERSIHGTYPADTILGMVDSRLRQMAETIRDFGGRH
ncbi:MAG: AAA family ATPase [Candidatus Sabulitectum sp.]|nr:AAA family ATPase [Candidatus Sabulitectum sp.]